MLKRPRVVVLVLLGSLLAAAQGQQKKDPIPDEFTNLQVLPKDISKPMLVDTMKAFTKSLGVRCNFCHVGQGDDLSTYNFASDDKEHKQQARVMLRMVREINQNHLSKLAEEGKEPPRVTCWTCHRGDEHVEMRPPQPKPGAEKKAEPAKKQ